ncbi:hypothetical protein BN903_266 [Halorubrum sp. AJ67]|nr:hypothetical protein BN903_266 [Halorubrum sp. AJ67]
MVVNGAFPHLQPVRQLRHSARLAVHQLLDQREGLFGGSNRMFCVHTDQLRHIAVINVLDNRTKMRSLAAVDAC